MTTYIADRGLRNSSCLPLRALHHPKYAAKTTLTVRPYTIRTGFARPTMMIRCLQWECALRSSRNAGIRIALCSIMQERPPTRILHWILAMCASSTFVLSAASQHLSLKLTRTGLTLTSIPSTSMIRIWIPLIFLPGHRQPLQESPRRTSN